MKWWRGEPHNQTTIHHKLFIPFPFSSLSLSAELFTFVWTLLKKRIEFLFRLFHRLCLPRISSLSPPFRPTTSFIAREHRTREIRTFRSMALFYDRKDSMLLKNRMLKAKTWQIRTQKIKSERRINCLRGNFGAALFFTVRNLLLPNNINSFGTQSVWTGPSWVTDHRRSSRSLCSVVCMRVRVSQPQKINRPQNGMISARPKCLQRNTYFH